MSEPTVESDTAEQSAGESAPAADGPDDKPQRPEGGVVGEQTGRPSQVEAAEELDWRGWLLVVAVVLSFLVVPVFVLFIPQMSDLIASFGFSARQAYLVFPMLPALGLGVISVWAAVRTQTN